MSQQTLKELLKPPFRHKGGDVLDANDKRIVQTCILLYKNKTISRFVAAALNEKWERDFSEPLRWIKKCIYGMYVIFCPKCDFSTSMNGIMDDDFKYCPHCGQRLYPPEAKA